MEVILKQSRSLQNVPQTRINGTRPITHFCPQPSRVSSFFARFHLQHSSWTRSSPLRVSIRRPHSLKRRRSSAARLNGLDTTAASISNLPRSLASKPHDPVLGTELNTSPRTCSLPQTYSCDVTVSSLCRTHHPQCQWNTSGTSRYAVIVSDHFISG